ncbi:winged helix-turn-helix domain-containing protein (plasmid) [Streptomyces sp. JL4002]|uniref:winged helix-turn-helix domain-containing protein n=1 Tax=Streptomyces sp. JL4002 TaxID=3404781 RepID=UPI003B2850BF
MAQPARRKFLAVVDEDTGAVEELPRAPYAFGGPHINVGIRRGRQLACADSGLSDREFRVLVWYWFATEECQAAVQMTGVAIAAELGMSPDALSKTVKVLKAARLLVESGGLGRTKFYRTSPYLAFIGSGFEHREAVSDWNPPEMSIPNPSERRRKKAKGGETA